MDPIGEKEKFLPLSELHKVKVESPHDDCEPQTRIRTDSIRDYLKNLGSLTSLKFNFQTLRSTRNGIVHQLVATFAVLVLSAACGQPIGFSAILLPQLFVENSTMHADLELGSWIASLPSVTAPIGAFASGIIMERWGRKRSLDVAIPFLIVGWILTGAAPHMALMFIARMVCGFSVGIMTASAQVYLGEFSDPWLRGMLIGTPFVSYSIGVFITFSMGNIYWRYVAYASLVLPIISFFLLFKMPESPVWLIRNSKIAEAHSALLWFRGDEKMVKAEMLQIAKNRDEEREKEIVGESFLDNLRKPTGYKPLLIVNIFNLLQIFSGTYIMIIYAVDVIRDATGEFEEGTKYATYSAIVRLVFNLIGCFFLLYICRRTLAIMSGLGSSIAALTLGIYLSTRVGEEKDETDFWISVTCIMIYVASNTLGFMMLPSLMVGEMYPEKIRGMCGGYTFVIFNILTFVTSKAYPLVKIHCGSHGLFLIFGISSTIATVFLYLFYPETKDKGLRQIEKYFETSKLFWINSDKSALQETK